MQSASKLLTVSVRPDRERAYVIPEGEIDLANAHEVRAHVDELRAAGFADIALDLRSTTFIDSTALKLMLELSAEAAAADWHFRVVPGPPLVQRVFEVTQTLERLDLVWPKPL
jgi:anti-anti-sigma factor